MTTSSQTLLHAPALRKLNIRPAAATDIKRIHHLAQTLICKDVAEPRTFAKVFARNRSTLMVVDDAMTGNELTDGHGVDGAQAVQTMQRIDPANDDLTRLVRTGLTGAGATVSGFIATLPLTALGEETLLAGKFSGIRVQDDWVAPETEEPAAVYIWALAGETQAAKAAIWKSALYIERGIYPGVPYYATAGSKTGEKLLTRLGYKRIKDSNPNAPAQLFGRTSHIGDSAVAAHIGDSAVAADSRKRAAA